jgi:hypothetical protein
MRGKGRERERCLWLIPICCGCIACYWSVLWPLGESLLSVVVPKGDSRLVWLKEFKDASSRTEIPSDSSKLSALLRRKMPQLACLSVEPGIPKIKRRLRTRKRPLETRLGFRGYTPRVGAFIERDDACCFPCFVGKVRYLRGHLRPPHKKA